MRRFVPPPLLLAVLAVGVSVVGASGASRSSRIDACYDANSGAIRVIFDGTSCNAGENPFSWNEEGAPGPTGGQGARGSFGPDGAEGPVGYPGNHDALADLVIATAHRSFAGHYGGDRDRDVVTADCPKQYVPLGMGWALTYDKHRSLTEITTTDGGRYDRYPQDGHWPNGGGADFHRIGADGDPGNGNFGGTVNVTLYPSCWKALNGGQDATDLSSHTVQPWAQTIIHNNVIPRG